MLMCLLCAACWTPTLRADTVANPTDATATADKTATGTSAVTAPSAAQPTAKASEPSELVCRREAPTGSHLGRRVCRTRAEIEADVAQSREAMGVIGRPGGGAGGGGG